MRRRSIGICLTMITVCTLGSTVVAAHLLQGVGADSTNEFLNGSSIPFYGTILFGFVGFVASLLLSPVIVISDEALQDHRKKMEVQQAQAGDNALSLLRAAECPPAQSRDELLRPAQAGSMTPPEQLLRAVKTEGSEA